MASSSWLHVLIDCTPLIRNDHMASNFWLQLLIVIRINQTTWSRSVILYKVNELWIKSYHSSLHQLTIQSYNHYNHYNMDHEEFPACIACGSPATYARESIQCGGCSRCQHRTCGTGITQAEYVLQTGEMGR